MILFLLPFFMVNLSCRPTEKLTTATVLKKINELQPHLKAFRCTSQVFYEKNGRENTSEGIVYYQYPNKYREENSFSGIPIKDILVINDSTIWNYSARINTIFKRDEEKIGKSISGKNYLALNFLDVRDMKFIGTSIESGRTVYILEGKKGDETVKNYIDMTDGLIRRQDLIDRYGNLRLKMLYSNYELNVTLEDNLFDFKIPEGATVIDESESLK